jgi:hypothetical protein
MTAKLMPPRKTKRTHGRRVQKRMEASQQFRRPSDLFVLFRTRSRRMKSELPNSNKIKVLDYGFP